MLRVGDLISSRGTIHLFSCLMVTLVSGWEPWYFSKEIRDMENIFGYMC